VRLCEHRSGQSDGSDMSDWSSRPDGQEAFASPPVIYRVGIGTVVSWVVRPVHGYPLHDGPEAAPQHPGICPSPAGVNAGDEAAHAALRGQMLTGSEKAVETLPRAGSRAYRGELHIGCVAAGLCAGAEMHNSKGHRASVSRNKDRIAEPLILPTPDLIGQVQALVHRTGNIPALVKVDLLLVAARLRESGIAWGIASPASCLLPPASVCDRLFHHRREKPGPESELHVQSDMFWAFSDRVESQVAAASVEDR